MLCMLVTRKGGDLAASRVHERARVPLCKKSVVVRPILTLQYVGICVRNATLELSVDRYVI